MTGAGLPAGLDAVAVVLARGGGLPPGAAEAIDWAQALALLGFESVERDDGLETLGWAVKNREDLRVAEAALVPGGA